MSDQYTPSDAPITVIARKPFPTALWKEVMFLDNFTCIYCGCRDADVTVDHFIPLSLGGPDIIQNLVACCSACNTKKGARAPYECRMAPQFGRYAYVAKPATANSAAKPVATEFTQTLNFTLEQFAALCDLPISTMRERLGIK